MQLPEFLEKLTGVRKSGKGYVALCPAHEDVKQSLSITSSNRGLGIKCHAGCEADQVIEALDLTWDDIFSDDKRDPIVVEYNYTDEHGVLLYQVLRYEDKQFRQRKPNGAGWSWNLNGTRRVPYMLQEILQADLNSPVFIVEGEKDVHTLRAKGYTATTNSGGAKWDWPDEWKKFFDGRRVIIIPDNDDPGFAHANQVAELLSDCADVQILTVPRAKDITDWFLATGADVDEFSLLVESAQPWRGPVEPARTTDTVPFTFPPAPVYDGTLGEIVKLIEPHSEADPKAIFMELLVYFGNCLGGGPTYMVGQTPQRGNLYLAIVGDTATARKGTAHDWAQYIFSLVAPEYAVSRVYGGLASGEGVIHSVRDPKTKTDRKGNVEIADEGVIDKRLLCFEPELAGRTFVAMKREGSSLSAILRQAWDNTPMLANMTRNNDEVATGAHLSVIGHCTIMELRKNLRPEDIAGGFVNRFLFFLVTRSKRVMQQTRPDENELRTLALRLRSALESGRRISRLTMTDDAAARWVELYAELDDELTKDEGEQLQFLARGLPLTLRMAMILAIVDQCREIDVKHLEQAIGLWQYSRKSVEYMLANAEDLTADEVKLFRLLDQNGPMGRRDIADAMKWSGLHTNAVCAKLAKRGVAWETTERTGQRGRPKKVIQV